VRFLVDANLPRALADWLREFGHEALHVDDLLGIPALDGAIWRFARNHGFNIISKDADFAKMADAGNGPQVEWVRCGNMKFARFQIWFAARSSACFRLLEEGEQLVELR
jgi:predicted nuclease of predicted toxin-antitoxin system